MLNEKFYYQRGFRLEPRGHRKQGRPLDSWRRTRIKELVTIRKTWTEAKDEIPKQSKMKNDCSSPMLHQERKKQRKLIFNKYILDLIATHTALKIMSLVSDQIMVSGHYYL